jgi:hypothetical protein
MRYCCEQVRELLSERGYKMDSRRDVTEAAILKVGPSPSVVRLTRQISLDEREISAPSVVGIAPDLPPVTDAYLDYDITVKDQDGNTVPGFSVSAVVMPWHLTEPSWRDLETLLSRYPTTAKDKLRDRVEQGVARLLGKVTPASAMTDSNGVATFRYWAIHICGGDTDPAADVIRFSLPGVKPPELDAFVRVGIAGMVEIPDHPDDGIVRSPNIRGSYVQSALLEISRRIGREWMGARRPPAYPSYPKYLTINDASLRWGGLFPPHLNHRFGGAVDIRPISTDGEPAKVGGPNYDHDGNVRLVGILVKSRATEIRFADNIPGVTAVDASHDNHLHVSWLRNPAEPW